MFEGEARFSHVVGVTDVDDRVAIRLSLGIGLIHDGKDCRPLGRRPTAEDPRALEGVPGERTEADHVPTCAFI
jgi:hypothetical protein